MTIAIPDYNDVLKACRGRKGLRTSKPKSNGFIQYVWRMARFHSGIDTHMPVLCDFDFDDWCNKQDPKPDRKQWPFDPIGSDDWHQEHSKWKDQFRDARATADKYADQVCRDLGYNPNAAALQWGRALGMI